MKEKTLFKLRKTYNLLFVACVLLLGSCAQGYESPNGFDVGVNNQQLQTPYADSIRFVVSTDGKTATITWPLVYGAKGYEATFVNVDNPDSIYVIDNFSNTLVDGTKMKVSVAEDSKYKLTLRVLGDPKRGNTDDPDSIVAHFSTLVPSVLTIPTNHDIYTYLRDSLLLRDSLFGHHPTEVAIDLEPNGIYTMSDQFDFGGQKLTFRGDKIKRPTINMIGNGGFKTYSGLILKFINFDFNGVDLSGNPGISTCPSLISMSNTNLPTSILSQNLGYIDKNGSLIKNINIVVDPIYIEKCWFKDMPNAMLYDNGVDCAYWKFTITDCIVQMKNTGTSPFVNLQTKGRAVKNILINNSTLFNTGDCGAYFMRYANSSNSNPQKIFGTANSEMSSTSITFSQATFSKTYNKGQFANNFNGTGLKVNVDHCIFYDCYQVARRAFDLAGSSKDYKVNFWYAVTNPDVTEAARKDNYGTPFAAVYDPQFNGNVNQSLNFSLPNAGVNFTPAEYQIVVNKGGDLRWITK